MRTPLIVSTAAMHYCISFLLIVVIFHDILSADGSVIIQSQSDCPEHFIYFQGSCYIIPDEYATSEECYVSTCNDLNATLATVTMKNIHFFRNKLVPTTLKRPIPNSIPDNMYVWIGLYYSKIDNGRHWINHHDLEINTRNSNFNVIKMNQPVSTGKCGAYCGRMNMKTLKWNFDFCNDMQHHDHQSGYPIDNNAFQTQLGGSPIFKCFCQYPRNPKSIKIFNERFKAEVYNITCAESTIYSPAIGHMAITEFLVLFLFVIFLILHNNISSSYLTLDWSKSRY